MTIRCPGSLKKLSDLGPVNSTGREVEKTVAIRMTGSGQKKNSQIPIWNAVSRR
jgi:hypothetical protein